MYSSLGVDNIDNLLQPPPPSEPSPVEAGMENSTLLMGGMAQAFPQQNHDAHIAADIRVYLTCNQYKQMRKYKQI